MNKKLSIVFVQDKYIILIYINVILNVNILQENVIIKIKRFKALLNQKQQLLPKTNYN